MEGLASSIGEQTLHQLCDGPMSQKFVTILGDKKIFLQMDAISSTPAAGLCLEGQDHAFFKRRRSISSRLFRHANDRSVMKGQAQPMAESIGDDLVPCVKTPVTGGIRPSSKNILIGRSILDSTHSSI